MRFAAAVVVAGGALAAAAAAAPVGEEPVPTRDCRSRGDPSNGQPVRFANPADVVVGPLSFASLRAASSRTAVYRRDDGTWFRKAGVKVLWGQPVTLTVPSPSSSSLRLEYTRPPPPSSVRFEPCPPGTRMFGGNGRLRRVTTFPGGFSFARPGCYELEVRVERGRTYRRTISLGAGSCRK
jgi:hypothetical protein